MITDHPIPSVSIIGAGGVATQLGTALHKNGVEIRSVYSRTMVSATKLAERIKAHPTDKLMDIMPSDVYIISVTDTALPTLLPTLRTIVDHQVVLHTAGSIPLSVLTPFFHNCGVLYPLQTFSRTRTVPFDHVPLLIEADSDYAMITLHRLATLLSDRIVRMDSERRKMVHLAAVFACNFANHCYTMASEILESIGEDYSLLQPLIGETADKAGRMHPRLGQTGPARRGDKAVMDRQLELLKDYPHLQDIYRLMSDDILRSQQQNTNHNDSHKI